MRAETLRPASLDGLGEGHRVDLDVREDLRRGNEPFSRIMAAVAALVPGQVLVLRAPFEPAPLYRVLGQRGFAHWTESHAADDWSVWIYPDRVGASAWRCATTGGPSFSTRSSTREDSPTRPTSPSPGACAS